VSVRGRQGSTAAGDPLGPCAAALAPGLLPCERSARSPEPALLAPAWRIPLALSAGVFAGAGLFVLHVSRAVSYLGDAPETCANCHVMDPAYGTWSRSSHARVAVCNDCHVPEEPLWAHYGFKAKDGARHSTLFTLGLVPEAIRISKGAVPVVHGNCVRCHGGLFESAAKVAAYAAASGALPRALPCPADPGDRTCWTCHREVPHGGVLSLSSTPRVFAPRLPGAASRQAPTVGGRAPRPDGGSPP